LATTSSRIDYWLPDRVLAWWPILAPSFIIVTEADIPIAKDVVALHVKGGVQWRLSERFLIDFYTGIGRRLQLVTDVEGRLDGRKMYSFWSFNSSEPGRYARISMSLGFKVGYLIYWKRNLPVSE
jgi:hypothetical protein